MYFCAIICLIAGCAAPQRGGVSQPRATRGIPYEYRTEVKTEFSKEKFAELIVRECAEIAYDYDAPKMSGPGMIIAGRIEEHFGVE